MKDAEAIQAEIRDLRKSGSQIYELDGTASKITGYSVSYSRTALVYIFYVLTCGLLRLVFHWCPRWMLRSTHTVCPLSEAHKVLIKDSAGVYYALSVMISIIDSHSGMVLHTYSSHKFKRLYPDVSHGEIKESDRMVYFFYKQLKYIWNEDQNQFCVLSESGGQPYANLFPVRPLSETVVSSRRALYEANEIAIHLTPITKVLLSECLNPFYCFQAFSCILWFVEEYWMYASCILVMSAISLCTQVYETRRVSLLSFVFRIIELVISFLIQLHGLAN
ncbi:hypothetical protein AHF37_10137 [Paragonimus kellicotti]|nr:hypothetical protein AHF37_10137 [Paragonimus kellicotti]